MPSWRWSRTRSGLDTRDGVSSAAVYAAMQDEGLVVERLYDTSQVLLGARNDAMVQSTNGALTLGFAIAMLTSIAGFIVFWVMALRTRTLQFGVLRAMGLRPRQVTAMLITELLVLAAGAALIGYAAGRLAGRPVHTAGAVGGRRRTGPAVSRHRTACRLPARVRGGGRIPAGAVDRVPALRGARIGPPGAQARRGVIGAFAV